MGIAQIPAIETRNRASARRYDMTNPTIVTIGLDPMVHLSMANTQALAASNGPSGVMLSSHVRFHIIKHGWALQNV